MRILFDQGTPAPLRHSLTGHEVKTAHEMGWSKLENGDLLRKADGEFELLITTDRNLRHQQNLARLTLAIVVLPTTSWPDIRNHEKEISESLKSLQLGDYLEMQW